MHPIQRQVSRRNLLKSATALGIASSLPVLMSACGGGDASDTPTTGGQRESRHLNFHLSTRGVASPRLQAVNSRHHNIRLQAHDTASRRRHRALNPLLQAVPDAQLTHYLEDVDLPAGALQLVGIWGEHPVTGRTVLAGHFLHVPTSALQAVEARRAARGQGSRALSLKMNAYGVHESALAAAPIDSQVAFNASAWDVATWLVFQHPSITNLQPDLGADILNRIQSLPCADASGAGGCIPYLGELAQAIGTLIGAHGNYPTTVDTGSWAMLVALVDDETGEAQLDEEGHVIYTYRMNEALTDHVASVVKSVLAEITNDPLFAGSNWMDKDGGPAHAPAQTPVAMAAALAFSARPLASPASVFNVASSIAVGKRVGGIRLSELTVNDNRAVRLQVRNEFLRAAGIYIEFQDANGKTLAVANPTIMDDVGGDGTGAKYSGVIQPDMQIMGVPLLGDDAPASYVQFVMPAAASKAIVYFGSLGLGGESINSKKTLIGALITATLNIGVPMIALVCGLAVDLKKGWGQAMKDAMNDPVTLKTILGLFAKALPKLVGGTQTSIGTLSVKPFLMSIGPMVAQMLLKSSPRIAFLLSEEVARAAVKEAIPVVGQALWVLSTLIDLAVIGETVVECVCSPALTRNEITLAMDSTVRISRDPDDYQFPATASKMRVTARYDGGATPRVHEGTLSTGRVDPIDILFSGVPSGGKVEITVNLYSDTDCLVGTGTSGAIVNLPATAGLIQVQIKEVLVPLNKDTTYQHQSKLAYQGGARIWDASAAVPSATLSDLCKGGDGSICAVHGITVHTPSGMVGYGYNASGLNVSLCNGGSATATSLVQNVFLGNNPDSGLKRSNCGSVQPMGIVYEARGPVTGGRNYVLRDGGDGFFELCRIDLVAGDFDFNSAPVVGRFHQALESLCVTSEGVVAGVNRNTNTMEVLKIELGGTDLADNFAARVAQKGSLDGRLDQPVAVAAYEGRLLVLEQGNRRVQAFDSEGGTLKVFDAADGSKTSSFPLSADPAVVYLDIAVEAMGYVYVLSSRSDDTRAGGYCLDVYAPTGSLVSRTTGVAAGALAVDLFRNVYTLNHEPVVGAPRIEPSVSKWLPHSDIACAPPASSSAARTASCQGSAQVA